MATRVTLTYADYAAIPNDGRRYELRSQVGPGRGTSPWSSRRGSS